MKVEILFCCIFFSFSQWLSGQSVSLDANFGNNGKVKHSFDVFNDSSGGVTIQSDGKILVCGINDFTINGNVYLTRYESDGSLDVGFGNSGIVVTPLITESDGVRIMKLLPDGKILVTSSTSISNNVNFFDFATMRFNANGSVDTTFGVNGLVQTDINNAGNYANGIEIQSDGKIIVAGNTYIDNSTNVTTTLVRYFADGEIDTSFGTQGVVTLNLLAPDTSQFVWDIKILLDDSILLGITTNVFETFEFLRNMAILKLTSNGVLDSSFGVNGSVISDFGAQDVLCAIDEFQGNIFMSGFSRYPGYKMIISKYTAQGILDQTFGNNGKVITNKDAFSTYDGLLGMKVLPNGKILCSGWTGDNSAKDALLIQFNSDGSIDTGFNQTGYMITDFDSSENSNFSFAIQDDGKILCTGWTKFEDYQDSTLVRYQLSNLSVSNFSNEIECAAFPNPFKNRIDLNVNLQTSGNFSADLFDSNGRLIKSLLYNEPFSKGNNSVELFMPESLAHGVYLLQVSDGNSQSSIKLVK